VPAAFGGPAGQQTARTGQARQGELGHSMFFEAPIARVSKPLLQEPSIGECHSCQFSVQGGTEEVLRLSA